MELSIVSTVGDDTPLFDLASLSAGAAIGPRDDLALRSVEADPQSGPRLVWSPMEPAAGVSRSAVSVKVRVTAGTPDLLGARVTALARLTSKPWWLRVKRTGATKASWLRCQACVPQPSSLVTAVDDPTQVDVVLAAETDPYAYGSRVEVPFTAGVAQKFRIDVNGVEGDAVTPAVILMRLSNMYPWGWVPPGDERWTITVRRDSDGYDPWFIPFSIDSGLSPWTGTPVTDTTAVSGQRRTLSWSGGATWTLTGRRTTARRGTYRLWVRGIPKGTFTIACGGRSVAVGDDGQDRYRMFDLGLVQVPYGQPPMLAMPGGERVDGTAPNLDVTITGVAGEFVFDALCMLPADDESARMSTNSGRLILDGYAQTVYDFEDTPTYRAPWGSNPTPLSSSSSSRYIGGAPRLAPGSNTVWICKTTGEADIAGTLVYWPLYTWLR